jgi:apolipoprotein N-acyltransferase
MAILRGVENGFSEVRTARLGRLTISDAYGRVNAEANSSQGKAVSLLGNVSLLKLNTIYDRWGDWFGILNMIAAIFFIFIAVKRYPVKQSSSIPN